MRICKELNKVNLIIVYNIGIGNYKYIKSIWLKLKKKMMIN